MKYEQIAELLKKRIAHGDYVGKDLPAELALARETGVSRMTARKALLSLVEANILVRQKSGRLACNRPLTEQRTRVALLTPAWASSEFDMWRSALKVQAEKNKMEVRLVDYVHWDDPALLEVLDSYRGVFLLPGPDELPDSLRERLQRHGRLVALGRDLSQLGILSINLFPAIHLNQLLDLFKANGHMRVDCLNVQPMDSTIELRIRQWRGWLLLNQLTGELHDAGCPPFSHTATAAYTLMSELLTARGPLPKALLCLSLNCALGAVRACLDQGLRPGRDIEICTVNGQGMARYYCPSLTCLEWGEAAPFLDLALQWMKSAEPAWNGPLILQPATPTLFIGETTSPPDR